MTCGPWLLAAAFGLGIVVGTPALFALAFLLPRKKQPQQLTSSAVHRHFFKRDDE